jgi:hypothetical protein
MRTITIKLWRPNENLPKDKETVIAISNGFLDTYEFNGGKFFHKDYWLESKEVDFWGYMPKV